jgi:BirA family biotin operon repressor/biotin-[acetyl-CoA-carboxylase] ligase
LASGLSAELLQHELRTSLFGRAARVLQETDSTIDLAREWVREGGPEGGVVIAARQRKGRGRLGRQWLSPMGGLWMSVIARPPLQIAAAGRLGVGMAVAGA